MLVIEDYSELVFLETFLKKLGFDVLGLNKDSNFADSMLGFFPEMVIATENGRQVNGIALAQKVQKRNGLPKVVLLKPRKQPHEQSPDKSVDAYAESPIEPHDFIQVIAQTAGLDASNLLEKYDKIRSAKMGETEQMRILKDEVTESMDGKVPSPAAGPDPVEEKKRASRFETAIQNLRDEAVDGVLPADRMRQYSRELRDEAEKDKAGLEKLNEQRRAFVRALFKK